MRSMIVAYVQTNPIFGNKEQNFKEIKNLIKGRTADLLVLPELFATGYTFISKEEMKSYAEEVNGPTAAFLMKIASKINGLVVGGFAEKERNNFYNSAMLVDKNEVLHVYRKVQMFYKENSWFNPGNKPLKVIEANGMKIGIMICFDWIFPEVARTLSLLGAEIIAHPANLVLPYCQKAMTTRCIENRVFAITANRIGHEKRGEDDFEFTGKSQITSPKGEILSSGPKETSHVDFVAINVMDARNKKINELNDLFKDRRTDLYQL